MREHKKLMERVAAMQSQYYEELDDAMIDLIFRFDDLWGIGDGHGGYLKKRFAELLDEAMEDDR